MVSTMIAVLGLVLVVSVTASHINTNDIKKRQGDIALQYPEQNPFGGMGLPDDADVDSIDYVCKNFCPKTSGGSDESDSLMAEIQELKLLIADQVTTLTNLNTAVSTNAGGSGSTDLVPKEYKQVYPVFHVQSDFGRYRYSLQDAKDACAENGGKLATYKQMQAAWERGVDLCQCGWIEEGYAVYPIQYPREGCTDKIGPGLRYNCDWQSTWNAWCFNKDAANKLP